MANGALNCTGVRMRVCVRAHTLTTSLPSYRTKGSPACQCSDVVGEKWTHKILVNLPVTNVQRCVSRSAKTLGLKILQLQEVAAGSRPSRRQLDVAGSCWYVVHMQNEEHRRDESTLGKPSPHDTTCGRGWLKGHLERSVVSVRRYCLKRLASKGGFCPTQCRRFYPHTGKPRRLAASGSSFCWPFQEGGTAAASCCVCGSKPKLLVAQQSGLIYLPENPSGYDLLKNFADSMK
jgi:hypothetical protein